MHVCASSYTDIDEITMCFLYGRLFAKTGE